MSRAQRAVAILVALLAVAAVAVFAFTVGGRNDREAIGSPSPSPVAAASRTAAERESPSAGASASAPSDEEALAIFASIESEVEAIRGLEPAGIGPPDLITSAELREELVRIFDAEYPPEERATDNIALRALGLLEQGQDVAELQLDLLDDSVLGFYDHTEQRMVVVSDAGLDAVAKMTYAHEYTHALQYAQLGLTDLEEEVEDDDDRALALTALTEGDATLTMYAWGAAHLTPAEQRELAEIAVPDTSGIPSWMQAQLEFPYVAGTSFVAQLAGELFSPDFSRVDAAFANPPASTEQVVDFAAWLSEEAPVAVQAPDLAAALGDGWEVIDDTPIGQASTGIILEYFGVSASDVGPAVDGWDGDRLVVASHPDGDFALAWRLAWETPADADAFAASYRAVIEALEFPASVTALADDEVLVVHASSDELHDETVAAAGG